MKPKELERFKKIDRRITEICAEMGLEGREITFVFVPPSRMSEAMAYGFPRNIPSWIAGRDFDINDTIWRHTGSGIPYEVIWGFGIHEEPKAFLVKGYPFALQVLINAHCRGHEHFSLSNKFLRRRTINLAEQARLATERVRGYIREYGREAVGMAIEATHSLKKYMDPTPFQVIVSEDDIRTVLLDRKKSELEAVGRASGDREERETHIKRIEGELKVLKTKTPPVPNYNVLRCILESTPAEHDPYRLDIANVLLDQEEYLRDNMGTKLANEGCASYLHRKITKRLFEEGRISDEEFGVASHFNSLVMADSKSFNWYLVGAAFFEDIEDRWNKGQFGKAYMDCKDPNKRQTFFRPGFGGEGIKKVFDIWENYNDRMIISDPELFSDEFIRAMEIFIWERKIDPQTGDIIDVRTHTEPDDVRAMLAYRHTLYGIPLLCVMNKNHDRRRELYIRHDYSGLELDPKAESGAMEYLYYWWEKPVHLETREIVERNESGTPTKTKGIIHSYDGKNHTFK
ncbi:SpoVR family protein [bacterium]|nr:SpoVR family protein [bacterium]